MSDLPGPETPQPTDKAPSKPRLRLVARLRAYFFAGILVTAPISITIYLAWLFIGFVDGKVSPLIPAEINPQQWGVPGVGVVVIVIILTLIGAFAAGYVGRIMVAASELLVGRMPVVRSVYAALKQIFETVLAQKSAAFHEVVVIEYPRRGVWTLAFLTGETSGEVRSLAHEDLVNVFVPTTPNPTSGFLLFLPRREVHPLKMSVEDGLKMVLSGGIITPLEPQPEAPVPVPHEISPSAGS